MNRSGFVEMPSPSEMLRFSGFEVDRETKELRRQGRPVKLPPQAMRLLEFLASHPGQLLTRESIRQQIWSDGTFVDFEHGINKSIRQIRDALHDDADQPKFVETIPRRGYRFIAQVEAREVAPATAAPAETAPPAPILEQQSVETPTAVPKPRRMTGHWLLGGAALSLACLGLLAFHSGGWRNRLPAQSRSKPIESLAVLPLENLSNDPAQDYFADGLTDEMITSLAKISALRVISRTSVMRYKGTKEPLPQVARELNVDAVLEGTVMRDHDRVRITAQLVAAAPEKHLWAEEYEGNLSEILKLQQAVAKAVTREIRIQLTPGEQTLWNRPQAVDPAAYEAYLKGRHLWALSGEANLQKSRNYFEQSIEKDPSYARAWAGLADTYNYLASWGVLSSSDARPRARAAAEKALELDDRLAGPLVALAEVKVNYEWDWAGAERLYRQAITLNSNDGMAHHGYATYLAAVGRNAEAVVEARRAHEVEPLSGIYSANVVWKLYLARRYEEAESEKRRLNQWDGYIVASLYLQTRRPREGVAMLRKAATESYAGISELMYLGHALGVTGDQAGAHNVLEQIFALSKQRHVPPEKIAIVYEGLGDREQALQWFAKAYSERSINIWHLADPRLDEIRKEPGSRKSCGAWGCRKRNKARCTLAPRTA
jgi:TolB-like protein/DNA-binding winged helix-turn-helix (wHTH) protein/Flp pilus assembly protein TadD